MDSNQLFDWGGGLTIVSLLSVLVNNFLVRKKEDNTLTEKVAQLSGQLAKIDQQQNELLIISIRLEEQAHCTQLPSRSKRSVGR
jgi:hypothetical protein